LKEPLPSWSIRDLTEVKLYNTPISPPSSKLRTILAYYKIKFENIHGPKPGSEYKKVPILELNGRQINDSFICVKNLAKIVDGKELSDRLLAVEEMATFGLMIEMEHAVARSCHDLCTCGCLLGGCQGALLSMFACCLCCAVDIKKGRELKTTAEYSKLMKEALGSAKFFHGKVPGIVDISVYGLLKPFALANTR
jgi:hypothetical protein